MRYGSLMVLTMAVAGLTSGVARAEKKVSGENLVREKLAEGMSVSEAFQTYGVI